MENDVLKIEGKGYFDVSKSLDPMYPGIDIEFVAKSDNGENLSRPRVVFEFPQNGELRLLIWEDANSEDYTKEIVFNTEEVKKKPSLSIAEKPIPCTDRYPAGQYKCPICSYSVTNCKDIVISKAFGHRTEIVKLKRCMNCGQLIDWDNI